MTLTDRGRVAADQLIAHFHQRHQRLFAAMTPQEREALATGLTAMLRSPSPSNHPYATCPPAAEAERRTPD